MPDKTVIAVVDEGMVATDGLWLTQRAFAPTLTPKGDCVKVHMGYIFVTRYQGGMDNRSVWLSRKKIGGRSWKHIQFPHRHLMFRKDKDLPEKERRGDAHNAIAIGICPKDDTIHLLYDMHAYTPDDFGDDYFNYSYSKKGAATVPDSEWTGDLFYPKQNYLSKSIEEQNPKAYHRITYPVFLTTKDGDLMVTWRFGGSLGANMRLTRYDGSSWGKSLAWNNSKGVHTAGFYGAFSIANDGMYACWHRRHKADQQEGYINNRGLYLAHCPDPGDIRDWYTAAGEKYSLPLNDLEPFKIAEPSVPGERMSSGASFIITPSGAFHAVANLGGETKHYYRLKSTKELQVGDGIPFGSMYAVDGKVYVIGLNQGRPVILSTPEATHDWQEELRLTTGRTYSHGVSTMADGAIYYYLMESGDADARPIHVLRFDLNKD